MCHINEIGELIYFENVPTTLGNGSHNLQVNVPTTLGDGSHTLQVNVPTTLGNGSHTLYVGKWPHTVHWVMGLIRQVNICLKTLGNACIYVE